LLTSTGFARNTRRECNYDVNVNSGVVTVNAGMSKFSGVVQCDTLITNSVVSNSYTPGAGNIW
jgi:hypothetical protein